MSEKTDHEIERKPIPPELQIHIPSLEECAVLDMTTQVRYQMLRQYMPEGQLPKDPKEAAIVIKLLDGMDKQDLTKKRLDIEKEGIGANSDVAKAALALVRQLSGGNNANPYEQPQGAGMRGAPTLDLNQTKDIVVSEGEKSMQPRDFAHHPEKPVEEE